MDKGLIYKKKEISHGVLYELGNVMLGDSVCGMKTFLKII